jgi:hypothetical protein
MIIGEAHKKFRTACEANGCGYFIGIFTRKIK